MLNPNCHPNTGVRYGVIACANLDDDLVHQLMFGPGADDLTYAAVYEEAKATAEFNYDSEVLEAEIAASEADDLMNDSERESFITRYLEASVGLDRDQYVEDELEQFSDCFQCDEPDIEGTHEGIKYGISWLGGAPLLTVYEGPFGTAKALCSICLPNAADLDSGFAAGVGLGYECYVVPRDWLAEVRVAA